MITANELNGVLGMMPAFATADATDIRATQTIAVEITAKKASTRSSKTASTILPPPAPMANATTY